MKTQHLTSLSIVADQNALGFPRWATTGWKQNRVIWGAVESSTVIKHYCQNKKSCLAQRLSGQFAVTLLRSKNKEKKNQWSLKIFSKHWQNTELTGGSVRTRGLPVKSGNLEHPTAAHTDLHISTSRADLDCNVCFIIFTLAHRNALWEN